MAIRPPGDLRLLESFLRKVSRISGLIQRGDESTIRLLTNDFSNINEDVIGKLPDVEYCKSVFAPVIYSSVYEEKGVHASIFGFSRGSKKLPLHDHPEIHGFIKCLRGALKIRSYSVDSYQQHPEFSEALYEGEKIVTPNDGVVMVQPITGNIHEIEALEDGSFFFDLLVPGYGERECTYFRHPRETVNIGELCCLEKFANPPRDFICHSIPYQAKVLL